MRLSSIFWIVMFVCAASALYAVKYRVQEMDSEIASLRAQIQAEKQSIHVLSAEWAFLTRPERVRRLAEKHLDMEPMKAVQMTDVADVPFPSGAPVRVVDSRTGGHVTEARYVVPVPQLRPGVVRAKGVGYVR